MKYILTSLLFVGFHSFATPQSEQVKKVIEAQPFCQNFIRMDQKNVYLGFGPYRVGLEDIRKPIPGRLRVVPIDGSPAYDLMTSDSVIDIVTFGNLAYVLTHSSLQLWDLEKKQQVGDFETVIAARPLKFKQHAEAMVRYKNKLIIAHGRLGITIFDLHSNRITNQLRLTQKQFPLESMATGVTVQGHYAYIVMDNYTLAAPGEVNKTFRGVVVIDLQTETIIRELGGMDPGADSVLSDSQKIYVSFGGIPIWKYSLNGLQGRNLSEPDLRIWRFPIKGGHPTGAAAMDDKYYYTCFSRPPAPGTNNGLMIRSPMAIDRQLFMLE